MADLVIDDDDELLNLFVNSPAATEEVTPTPTSLQTEEGLFKIPPYCTAGIPGALRMIQSAAKSAASTDPDSLKKAKKKILESSLDIQGLVVTVRRKCYEAEMDSTASPKALTASFKVLTCLEEFQTKLQKFDHQMLWPGSDLSSMKDLVLGTGTGSGSKTSKRPRCKTACTTCRIRKVKCDGIWPCQPCVDGNTMESCVYRTPGRRVKPNIDTSSGDLEKVDTQDLGESYMFGQFNWNDQELDFSPGMKRFDYGTCDRIILYSA